MKVNELIESQINDDDYYLVDKKTKKIIRSIGNTKRFGYFGRTESGEIQHSAFDQYIADKTTQAVMKGMTAKHMGYRLTEATNTVELTAFDGDTIPHSAWTDGVMYKGMNVFDTVYKNRPAALTHIEKHWKAVGGNHITKVDFQEVYLGYSPSKDAFVQGYDGWGVEEIDYDNDEYEDVNISPYIVFKLDDQGKVKILRSGLFLGSIDSMWYSRSSINISGNAKSGYDAAHKIFPDLIDIRLD